MTGLAVRTRFNGLDRSDIIIETALGRRVKVLWTVGWETLEFGVGIPEYMSIGVCLPGGYTRVDGYLMKAQIPKPVNIRDTSIDLNPNSGFTARPTLPNPTLTFEQ